jgi:hypothetical protein
MAPEELAATLLDFAVADSVHTAEVRHRLTEAAAHLRRLAALERENERWRGWWFSQGHRGYPPPEALLREALAGAPDAPDAQESGE